MKWIYRQLAIRAVSHVKDEKSENGRSDWIGCIHIILKANGNAINLIENGRFSSLHFSYAQNSYFYFEPSE